MRHLSPDTFIDLIDGTRDEAAVPHLTACAACRERLADLRRTWNAAVDIEVPEPSPLFWEHLSARVRHDVAAEPEQLPRRWTFGWRSRIAALAGAAAAVAAVAVLHSPAVPSRATEDPAPGAGAYQAMLAPLPPAAEDPSLRFVADLATTMDWDSAGEAGFGTRGVADRAVAEMDDAERLELQRLLHEALGDRGNM